MATPHALSLAAAAALLVFSLLALVDGAWIHLIRLRLHARSESRLEHALHTGRALLTPPLLLTVFGSSTGAALWIGVALLLVDQALEAADVAVEWRSRAPIGGLGAGEYALHGALVTARAVAVSLALASRPPAAWLGPAPYDPGPLGALATLLLPGACIVALAHAALLAWPALLPAHGQPGLLRWRCCPAGLGTSGQG